MNIMNFSEIPIFLEKNMLKKELKFSSIFISFFLFSKITVNVLGLALLCADLLVSVIWVKCGLLFVHEFFY